MICCKSEKASCCPLALYHDRHGIFSQTRKATEAESLQEQLAGTQEPTQFARLLQELAITSIAAQSPQAKGRVERLFGTLQDRLVVELRLAGACTLDEANVVLQAYLPRFNAQFAVEPAQAGLAYHQLSEPVDLDTVFCFKYVRTVALDNTVSLGEHRLQLLPDRQRPSYARAQVQVHERFDGRLVVYYAGRCLASTAAPLEAPLLRARKGRRLPPQAAERAFEQVPPVKQEEASVGKTRSAGSVPRPDHPWRKPLLPPKQSPALVQRS